MSKSAVNECVDVLRRLALRDGDAPADGALLEAYATHRDEAALTALVQRHGGMVWGVCRRVLGGVHDAEDAFQATFLVLLRKAASIRDRNGVANWLYGVAQQTAIRVRSLRARQAGRERQVAAMPDRAQSEQALWSDVAPILDEELGRLPEMYRAVIVVCDLEEKSRSEAARRLGWPEGTVAGRLARARALLASRLTRRGVATSAGALAATLAAQVAAAPTGVLTATVQAALAGTESLAVATLVNATLRGLFVRKLKVGFLVLALVLTCAGGGLMAYWAATRSSDPEDALVDSDKDKPEEAMPKDRILVKGRLLPKNRMRLFALGEGRVVGFKDGVEAGGEVRKDEEVIRMFSADLGMQLGKLDVEIRDAQGIIDLHRDAKNPELRLKALEAEATLKAKVAIRQRLIERTNAVPGKPGEFLVKSPMTGTILTAGFREKLIDRQVNPAEPLLHIGATKGDWEIEATIPQTHIGVILNAFKEKADKALDVEFQLASDRTRKYRGKLDRWRLAAEAGAAGLLAWIRMDGDDIAAGERLPRHLLLAGVEVEVVILNVDARPSGDP